MPIRHGGTLAISDSKSARAHFRLDRRGLAAIIDAVYSKYVLGEIDSYGDNIHGLPLSRC